MRRNFERSRSRRSCLDCSSSIAPVIRSRKSTRPADRRRSWYAWYAAASARSRSLPPAAVARESVGPPHTDERTEHIRIDGPEHFAHHDRFLEAVDQHPSRIGRVVAQHAPAEAVEGGDPRLPVVVLQPFVDPPRHLVSGPGGERERQDLVAPRDVLELGLLVQVDQRARLPGARPRENPERTLDVVDVEWQSVYL